MGCAPRPRLGRAAATTTRSGPASIRPSRCSGRPDERRSRRLAGPRPKRPFREELFDPEPDSFELRIEMLEMQVGSYLYSSGEADYDVALVEAVARHTQLHPITPGYDPQSYRAPLAAERGAQS